MSAMSRGDSELDSDSPRASSPSTLPRSGRDSDWSFARREAASAILGSDQKISDLNDDELDALFDDLQRVRADRKTKTQSRLFDREEFEGDSETSYAFREKYASNGTIDNFSLDTVLTIPSTPRAGEEDDRLRIVREDMQQQLEKQKEDYQAKLKSAEESHVEIEEIRAEKEKMELALQAVKEDMQRQLKEQREEFEREKVEFERQLSVVQLPGQPFHETDPEELLQRQRYLASTVLKRWRGRSYVKMAETVLQNAVTLKEAQVMSQQMDKQVVFQYCIADIGHTFVSSYDLVLNDVSGEDDEDLEIAQKPCLAIRLADYKNQIVHIWSLEKLKKRVRLMRQMHQYLNHPDYAQHFRLENPFTDPCLPQYSRIGDVDIPLAAVFEARVQDFSLEVMSPYTFGVVGIVRLSLEPSSAEAPSSTLKFNVVMHNFVGFPEREGTEVHAQLFVLGISDEGGATTTQLIKDFDEGPIRFESVHSMALPMSSPRTSALRVSIFARVTPMHIDKLLSWDDMRDSAPRPKQKPKTSRLPESEFYTEEKHNVFSRVQIQEISESGTYEPVDVIQQNALDGGAYQLHQGLQRRIVVDLTHSSGKSFQWKDVSSLRVGKILLLDPSGKTSDSESSQNDVPLKVISPPTVIDNADGTTNVTLVGQWDSSAHGSCLLDRATADRYRVQVTLLWDITSSKLMKPMVFSLDLSLQIRSRAYIRQSSMLMQLWNGTRVVHSTTGNFSIAIKPTSAKRAADLWRMNTQHDYVKGEEALNGWTPRGVSLVQDYISNRKRRMRIAEIEAARGVLSTRSLAATPNGVSDTSEPLTERQELLLRRVLKLWQTKQDNTLVILARENVEPPRDGAAFARTSSSSYVDTANGASSHMSSRSSSNSRFQPPPTQQSRQPTLIAEVRYMPKNPALLKAGYVLMPDSTNVHWCKRYIELRKPYLHVYSVPEGDELNAINLANARIDHEPQLARLMRRPGANAGNVVWAVFGVENTYLFASRSEREKLEWILRVDESYFSSGESGGSSEADGEYEGYDD